jgi:TrmH RNA methyltransferase
MAKPAERDKLVRIAGLPAVRALFERSPGRVERLFFEPHLRAAAGGFCRDLARARKPYREVDADELARVAGTVLHGGIVAVAHPNPVLPFDPENARRWAETGAPLFLLDGIGNPHNLGAIARTAAFFGLDRLVLSDHPGQAGPSEAAHRVAEGGLEYVQLYKAARFAATLKRLRPHYRVVGTALTPGAEPMDRLPTDRPLALILGNEEDGLPRTTLEACDNIVMIPGAGPIQSLNVAATAAILIHHCTRNRK